MATYTQNYTLHQWEDTDDFLRTDFNTDFAKIDTALGRAERSATSNAYNIYNLILQNYYESKYTGYKSALLFDGFMDDSGILSRTDEITLEDGALTLTASGQEDITCPHSSYLSSQNVTLTTPTMTMTGNGTITGMTVYASNGSAIYSKTINLYVNGTLVESGTIYYSDLVSGALHYTLQNPTQVCVGDTVYFCIVGSGDVISFYGVPSTQLGGILRVTPTGAESGTVTAQWDTDTAWTTCHLWLRHTGGALTPTLNDTEMTLVQSTDAQTLDGVACTESQWFSETTGDPLSLQFDLQCLDDSQMTFHDYGAVLV